MHNQMVWSLRSSWWFRITPLVPGNQLNGSFLSMQVGMIPFRSARRWGGEEDGEEDDGEFYKKIIIAMVMLTMFTRAFGWLAWSQSDYWYPMQSRCHEATGSSNHEMKRWLCRCWRLTSWDRICLDRAPLNHVAGGFPSRLAECVQKGVAEFAHGHALPHASRRFVQAGPWVSRCTRKQLQNKCGANDDECRS